jgi:hypothetical protein
MEERFFSLLHMYGGFIGCAASVDPDQPAHPCHLIRITSVYSMVRNNQMNLTENNIDPDETAQIRIYSVYPCDKSCIYGVNG